MVSVVITTKNRQHLLPRAIESVLTQSDPDVEVIVVDDGSDQPATYNGESEKLTIIRNEQSVGVSAARNIGFRAAKGDYFALLDDDDFYFPDKIKRQREYLESHPDIALVFSRVVVQDAAGNRRCYLAENHVHTTEINLEAFNVIHPASVLFRRFVFDHIQFDHALKKYEDTLFFNQVCLEFQTAYLPMDAAVWMQDGRPDQLTRVFYKRNYDNFRIVCSRLAGYLTTRPRSRRRYYGRLAIQALRCGYLGATAHSLLRAM